MSTLDLDLVGEHPSEIGDILNLPKREGENMALRGRRYSVSEYAIRAIDGGGDYDFDDVGKPTVRTVRTTVKTSSGTLVLDATCVMRLNQPGEPKPDHLHVEAYDKDVLAARVLRRCKKYNGCAR